MQKKLQLSLDSTVVAGKGQVSTCMADEVMILHLEEGFYYGLKEVGARVWDLIREPVKVSQIYNCLLQEYAVDPTLCEQDLLVLLEGMASEGLIDMRDGTTA